MTLAIILLTTILNLTCPHVKASESWVEVGFSGGDIADIASFTGDPDIILACVGDHGIYRSTNSGEYWLQILGANGTDIEISGDGTAYIASTIGLLISHDYGETWTLGTNSPVWRLATGSEGFIAAIPEPGGSSTDLPVQLSRDYGQSWETWNGTENTTSLFFHEDGTVFRAAGTKVFQNSPSNWDQWTLLREHATSSPSLQFAFTHGSILYAYSLYRDYHPVGSQQGGVFRSSDNGATWERHTTANSVTALSRYGDTLFIGTPDGAILTARTDSPDTTLIGRFGAEITAIDARRFDQGEMIIGTRSGIFKTSDGAESWHKSDTGIRHQQVASVQTIPVGNGGERILAASVNGGMYYSDDNGRTWKLSDPDMRTAPRLLKVSQSEPYRIFAAESTIYHSDDAGTTWAAIDNVPLSYYGWYGETVDFDIDSNDPGKISIVYDDHSIDDQRGTFYTAGIYEELDNPYYDEFIEEYNEPRYIYRWSWEQPRKVFEDGGPTRIQITPGGESVWISRRSRWGTTSSFAIARYQSDTILDSITLPHGTQTQVWLIDGQHCYAYGHETGILYDSHDLGESWHETELQWSGQNNTDYTGDIIQSPDKSMLYFLYPGIGILVSHDNGTSWEPINNGLDTDIVYQLAFSRADPSVTYAATENGLYRLGAPPDIVQVNTPVPQQFNISRNYPNPFNPYTTIEYNLGAPGTVRIDLYDTEGRKVRTLANDVQSAGTHHLIVDCSNLASGMYFCRFHIAGMVETRRIMLVK